MSPTSSAAADGHDPRAAAVDLSNVFGAAAAASVRRRFRPRRTRRTREPPDSTSHADELATVEIMEDDVHDARSSRAPVRPARGAAQTPDVRRSDAPAPRRRFGAVKVRDRQHVDLLLLAAAATGPANGHELIDLVRERSDGLFTLSLPVVVQQLHRLTNNRLLQVTGDRGARRRYFPTPLGERVLATRRREWEAFSHGLDRVLDAADDGDRSRDGGRGRTT